MTHNNRHSPCADAEAVREQTGSEEQGVVAGVGAQVERGAV